MEFDKITVSDDGVAFEWEKIVAVGTSVSERMESEKAPAPALTVAMNAFKPYVCELLDFPASIKERIEIRTAHLKVDDKTALRTLQLVCILTCPNAGKKTTTFTTPLMRERGDTEGGYFLEDAEMELIEALEEAAMGFVERGERLQPELFPPQQTETEPDKKDETPKRRATGKKKGQPESVTGGIPQWNEAGEPYDDAKIRELLARVDRAVPVDAIAAWTAGERDQAVRWGVFELQRIVAVRERQAGDIEEPLCVQKSATLPLSADNWTAPELPPKLSDNGAQKVKAAKEHDLAEAR